MKIKQLVLITLFMLSFSLLAIASNQVILKSDNDKFNGYSGNSTTHQIKPKDQSMKVFDIPADALKGITEARVRVNIGFVDYSQDRNGFTEDMEMVINGKIIKVPLNQFEHGVHRGQIPVFQWYDLGIPVIFLKPGENKVVFRKVESTPQDDYIYIAIDNSVSKGKSAYSMDHGETWNYEKLNHIGAKGEYMVRLVLIK